MTTKIPFTAATDLRALQRRVVSLGGTLASTPDTAHGLYMDTRVNSGQEGTMLVMGRGVAHAGGAITKGARLQVTSGGFVTVAASGDHTVGLAETAASSGGSVRGVFNFLNIFLSSSAGV